MVKRPAPKARGSCRSAQLRQLLSICHFRCQDHFEGLVQLRARR